MAVEEQESSEKSAPSFCPEWAGEKRVSIIGIALLCILILLCFFIFIPVAITANQADGNCFLYADTHGFGAWSVCSYVIALSIILLLFCALRLALLVYKIISSQSVKVVNAVSDCFSVWGVHLVIFILDACLLLLLLITACLLSAGLSHLCDSLFGGRSRCSSSHGVRLPDGTVNKTFYDALTFAEGSAWCALVFWLLVVIYETILAWKNKTFSPVVKSVQALRGGKATAEATPV